MPDQIDLEPHEYRGKSEQRIYAWAGTVFGLGTTLGLYVTGLLFDYRGWGIVALAMMAGACLIARFPRFFLLRDR